jgi:hypothetical protein
MRWRLLPASTKRSAFACETAGPEICYRTPAGPSNGAPRRGSRRLPCRVGTPFRACPAWSARGRCQAAPGPSSVGQRPGTRSASRAGGAHHPRFHVPMARFGVEVALALMLEVADLCTVAPGQLSRQRRDNLVGIPGTGFSQNIPTSTVANLPAERRQPGVHPSIHGPTCRQDELAHLRQQASGAGRSHNGGRLRHARC